MSNWFTVFRFELGQQITRKAYLLTTFGIPLLGALALGGYLGYQELDKLSSEPADDFDTTAPIGLVDESQLFTDPAPPFDDLIWMYDTLEAGKEALSNEDIDSLYVLSDDYLSSGEATLWVKSVTFTALDSNLLEAYLLTQLTQELPPATVARLRYPIISVQEQKISETGEVGDVGGFGANFLVVYVFALCLMMSTLVASGYLLQSVVAEKESRIIEIMLTSVKPFPLLLGKTLAMALTGLAQIIVWLLAAYFLLNLAAQNIVDLSAIDVKPITLVLGIVYFLLGFGLVGGIFAMMGALVNSARDGSQLAGWIVFPIIIPLFFTTVFAESPNSNLPVLLTLIPFTSPLAVVMRSTVTEIPAWQLAISIGLTFFIALGAIWMAGRMFRVGTLLRGATPKLREIPRLIWED